MGGQEFNRDVDEALVQKSNDNASLAGHCGVDSVAREQIAEQCVLTVRRAAADLVTRVEVTHDDGNAFAFEERLDLLAQKWTYVPEPDITGSVARAGIGGQQILPCAFRNSDHGV